jgi:membrane protein
MLSRLRRHLAALQLLITRGIWQTHLSDDRSWLRPLYAVLRVLSITITGLREIRVFSRSAALSYSSLLGIGPLIAIAVLVAGTVLQSDDRNIAVEGLHRLLKFIAPQLDEFERAAAEAGAVDGVVVNPQVVELIESFISASQSGTLGIVGALLLVVIVIQLFISVEESFNSIWGVRQGRPLLMRIVMYWTLVTLGAVLSLAALSLLSAATIAAMFDNLPFGAELLDLFRWAGPLGSFVLMTSLLTAFYRFIPNTNVFWRPALVGAVVVVVLLFLNNYLAFFYVKRVLLSQSLFGSLSILPVLMVGLYVFWFFVLLGGQITYAVQNVHYRSSQSAWHELNQASRESLCLLVLVLIGRRFKQCAPPYTASQLSAAVRVPTQVLNECLNRLIDMRLVSLMPPGEGESSLDYHYQPARPLERISLLSFRQEFAHLGTAPSGALLDAVDPVLRYFHERLEEAERAALGDRTIDDLLEEFPANAELLAPPRTAA